MNITIPYVNGFLNRGRMVYYYRRGETRVRLRGEPGTAEFLAAYRKVHDTFEHGSSASAVDSYGTFGYLVVSYYASTEFTENLKAPTRTFYRRYLDPLKAKWGKVLVSGLTQDVVIAYRTATFKAKGASAANKSLTALKSLLVWARANNKIPTNPAIDVKPIKRKVEGWKPWPDAALERFASKTTGAVRIAFMLALHTGQRRADVLTMKWSDITDGGIAVTQSKTGAVLWIPLHPVLARELAEAKKATKGMTIVQREDGKPYTDSGFASVWNKAQHDFGCVGMPMHGLRKNATQALFEAGCTDKQVQAITGHETLEMLNLYGKGANQKRLAKQAMGRLENNTDE